MQQEPLDERRRLRLFENTNQPTDDPLRILKETAMPPVQRSSTYRIISLSTTVRFCILLSTTFNHMIRLHLLAAI
uniref:Uncharacterized protein n=1 Tax=Parascaris univalens TaxID=6257 RepID=A0A915ATX2_PARUN